MTTIQPRSVWGAAARTSEPAWLPNSVGLAVHWEGPRMGAYPQANVTALLRSIQRYHQVNQGWADIAYNFVVDRWGGLWEGRGWNARSAANGTNDGNTRYLAVCYLGGEGDDFTPAAQAAIASLHAQHVARGGSGEVVGHRDCTPTACPGDTIYSWVRSGGPTDQFAPAAIPEEDVLNDDDKRFIQDVVRLGVGDLRSAIAVDTRTLLQQNQPPAGGDVQVDVDKLGAAIARSLLNGVLNKP